MFDQIESSIRHIPDVYFRHYVVQVSGLMWAVSFSETIGRDLLMTASILGKSSLIATAIFSMATFAVAVQRPKLFMRCLGRRSDGKANFSLIFSGHKLKVKIVNAGPLEKRGQGIATLPTAELFEILPRNSIAAPKRGKTTCGY